MKIVHITDFHYNAKNPNQQDALVKGLINTIQEEGSIDLIFFTGDLVDKGGQGGKDFEAAYEALIVKLVDSNIISRDNVFICCGNHDINRGKEISAIKTHVDNMNSLDDLNNFVSESDTVQFKLSLKNLEGYLNIQKIHYKKSEDYVHELYTVHKRMVNGKNLGIVTINSAWRSFDSSKDKGNLLFPTLFIEDAISKIKECEVKLFGVHHPLTDLKDFNFFEVETLVYNNFHFIFSGHTHLDKIETHVTGNEGIFSCVSPSTLAPVRSENKVGFTIVEVDDENFYEAKVKRYTYDRRKDQMLSSDVINVTIPLSEKKADIMKIRTTVRRKLAQEIDTANDLILSNGEDSHNKKSFLDLFTTPSLKSKSKAEITSSNDLVSSIELTQLLDKNNYVIFGKSKSGRTSILYKTLIDALKGFPNNGVLPLYVDSREYKDGSRKWDLSLRLSRYYERTRNNILTLSNNYHFKLLIDNYTTTQENFLLDVIKSIESLNVSVVLCTDEIVSKSFNSKQIQNFKYSALYIHDISRKNVRSLVKKWSNKFEYTDEFILNRINKVFVQLNIPSNYWTVSLFLWVFEKSNNVTLNNNIELIQLYIDELLDRTSIVTNKSLKIRFEDLKEYLGELAFYLLSNHGENLYSATYAEIITFTEAFRERNFRFVISVEEVVQLVIDKSVLKKNFDERFSFRLNGIFEYFLALYLTKDEEYRNKVIADHSYLSFGNELELYVGFRSKDKAFIEAIFDKTKSVFMKINDMYGDESNIDQTLLSKFESIFKVDYGLKKINSYNANLSALSPEDQDAMMDEMRPIHLTSEEVKLKPMYSNIDSTVENLEKSLKILARVLKNSSIEDKDFNREILDYVLLSVCHLGFTILDDITSEESKSFFKHMDESSHKNLVELTAKFMPLIINTILVESLAQDNLERLILNKIESLGDGKENQFQILLLYFLLIDLNPAKSLQYIDDLINKITYGVLRQTILVKLYTYIVFHTYNNEKFFEELKKLIRKLRLLIDPKSKNQIEKELQLLRRKSLVERVSS